ncbi:hypothetical protein [Nostoc sp. CCY 9925]
MPETCGVTRVVDNATSSSQFPPLDVQCIHNSWNGDRNFLFTELRKLN